MNDKPEDSLLESKDNTGASGTQTAPPPKTTPRIPPSRGGSDHYGSSHIGMVAIPSQEWNKTSGKWFVKAQQSFATMALTHHIGIQPVYYVADPALLEADFATKQNFWTQLVALRPRLNLCSPDTMEKMLPEAKKLIDQFIIPADVLMMMYVNDVAGLPGKYLTNRGDGENDVSVADRLSMAAAARGKNATIQAICWRDSKQCMHQEVRDFLELWLQEQLTFLRNQDMRALLLIADQIEQQFTFTGKDTVTGELSSPEARAVVTLRLLNEWLSKRPLFAKVQTKPFTEAAGKGGARGKGISKRMEFYEDINLIKTALAGFKESKFPVQLSALSSWASTLNLVRDVDVALQRMDVIEMLTNILSPTKLSMAPGQQIRMSSAQGESMWNATARLNIIAVRHEPYPTSFHGCTFYGYLPKQWRSKLTYSGSICPQPYTDTELQKYLYSTANIEQAVRIVESQYYDKIDTCMLSSCLRAFETTASRNIIVRPIPGPDSVKIQALFLSKAVINPMISLYDVHRIQHVKWPLDPDVSTTIAAGPGVWITFDEKYFYGSETQSTRMTHYLPFTVW